ncbi:MAG: DNA double-strand break repair nuclease NurA [Candidatus Nanohaloarchaea archaeon]
MAGIEEAARELKKRQSMGKDLEEKFKGVERIAEGPVVKESVMSRKVDEIKPQKVAGVDGGISRRSYSHGEVVATRAVAAVFNFGEDGVESEYIPGKNPEPDFKVLDAVDRDSVESAAERERLEKETSVAGKAIDRAGRVFMDGSVVPSYSGESGVIRKYESLFRESSMGQLVGVVEDSHGLKTSELIKEKLGIDVGRVRDTLMMDAILEEGERSFVRRYSKGPVEHPVLKKMDDDLVEKIHTFYIKISKKDLPLRIDYFGEVEDADRIAGELSFMASSPSYTVPSPVVEADRRAKIEGKVLERLERRFNPGLKRRNRRSF